MESFLKLTELTEASNVVSGDYFDVSKDTGGDYLSQKVDYSNVVSSISNSLSLNNKATIALDNLASVAINTSLISDTDSTDDLGSTSKQWANVHADRIVSTISDLTIENDLSDGDIIFKVNDGGVDTTVMTIDGATGNVGIGTASPSRPLDIRSDTGFQLGAGEDVDHYLSSDDYYIDNVTSNKDVIIRANDGGTMRTAIQINGDEGSVTMPRQSYVYAYLVATQTIPNTTVTTIVFSTEVTDVLGEYNNSTGYFTAKDEGVYHVSTSISWDQINAGAYYQTRIDTSGGFILNNNMPPTNTATLSQTLSGSFKLAAGGTIRVWVYQGSGGNENIGVAGTDVYNTLTITKVS